MRQHDFDLMADDGGFKEILMLILRIFDNKNEVIRIELIAYAHQYEGRDIQEKRTVIISKEELRKIGLKDDLIPTEDEVKAVAKLLEHKTFTYKELSNSGITLFSDIKIKS